MAQIIVGYSNHESVLHNLKKVLHKEGIYKVVKNKRYYEKPSEEKRRKSEEAKQRRIRARNKKFS